MNKSVPLRALKVPLKKVLRDYNTNIHPILDYVEKVSTITYHGMNLLKLYLLKYPNTIPTFELIHNTFKCFIIRDKRGKQPQSKTLELQAKIKDVRDRYYPQVENIKISNIDTTLDYASDEVLTAYNNNIWMRHYNYVRKYVYALFGETKTKAECKKIIDALLDDEETKDEWVNEQRKLIRPEYKEIPKDFNIKYDLKANTFNYLKGMKYMLKVLEEKYNENKMKREKRMKEAKTEEEKKKIMKEAKGEKLYALYPLRKGLIPINVTIDTRALIKMFAQKGTQGNLIKKQKQIKDSFWSDHFKINEFEHGFKNFKFHGMIKTDGISCSLLFEKGTKKTKEKEPYIDSAIIDSNKKIVAIDPNKGDLIYCVDSNKRTRNHFRYTQDQRREECGFKQGKLLNRKLRKEIQPYMDPLSEHNKKTVNINKFIRYLRCKIKTDKYAHPLYKELVFRKQRLRQFIRTKKSENKLIKNFKHIFGKPKNTIIAFGDWSETNTLRYKEPTKGKGFRTLFRKNGYQVYLVDEYRTSKMCSCCEIGECKTFLQAQNPRPWKQDKTITVHGLLKCSTCNKLWNRDENSSSNIYKIAQAHRKGKERPIYLRRGKQNQEQTEAVPTLETSSRN